MLVTHIDATADGLSIKLFGKALLNWPRLQKYTGAELLPDAMKNNPSLYGYSLWEVSAEADVQEGFMGIRIGRPSAPPGLEDADEDTIGCMGFLGVRPLMNPVARKNLNRSLKTSFMVCNSPPEFWPTIFPGRDGLKRRRSWKRGRVGPWRPRASVMWTHGVLLSGRAPRAPGWCGGQWMPQQQHWQAALAGWKAYASYRG